MGKGKHSSNSRLEMNSFLAEVSRANEKMYLILISLYVVIFYMLKIAWRSNFEQAADMLRYAVLSIVMWGSAIYLFLIIASWKKLWKKNIALIVTGMVILVVTGLFSAKMSTNLYGAVMDLFFCVMACGKDYKKILKCMLIVSIVMLTIAAVGVPLGFTLDLEKPDYITMTHSLGIVYPNTWGYLVFLALMLLWYLYLRHKPVITFTLFWSVALFMFYFISCNTIAALAAIFPVLALVVDFTEGWADKKDGSRDKEEIESVRTSGRQRGRILGWVITSIPLISVIFMYVASINYEWMHAMFYGTRLRNFAMRFVQGGLYFKTYGLNLIGNVYRDNQFTYVNVNGSFEEVGILDSSFAAYIIMRGILWVLCIMLWLCLANWKALKEHDYAIPFLGAIILLFAMMERPGLEMWYNFILLYPLAKVAGKPGTERVLQLGVSDE